MGQPVIWINSCASPLPLLSVGRLPVLPPALNTPISPEAHQQAAETGDTIIDVQAVQAAALAEEQAQEEENANK